MAVIVWLYLFALAALAIVFGWAIVKLYRALTDISAALRENRENTCPCHHGDPAHRQASEEVRWMPAEQ